MAITDLETQRIAFTSKTLFSMLAAVIVIVSSYFIASERINARIDENTNKIEDVIMLYESQENLIMANRYKDSIEIEYLRYQIKKR